MYAFISLIFMLGAVISKGAIEAKDILLVSGLYAIAGAISMKK